MKKLWGIFVIIFVIVFVETSFAQTTATDPCHLKEKIVINTPILKTDPEPHEQFREVFSNPEKYFDRTSNKYLFCFDVKAGADFVKQTIDVSFASRYDVYISGLHLTKHTTDFSSSSDDPKFKAGLVVSGFYQSQVTINAKVSGFDYGLILENSVQAKIQNSVFTGLKSTGKGGACIYLRRNEGVELVNVEASQCDDGVLIQSHAVTISGSKIHENLRGVNVSPGFQDIVIRQSLIYGNNDDNETTLTYQDGVWFGTGANNDLGNLILCSNASDKNTCLDPKVKDYTILDSPEIKIPRDLKAGETGYADVYLSDPVDCGLTGSILPIPGQACKYIATVTISGTELSEKKKVVYKLDTETIGKKMVVIYTDPNYGSTTISQVFKSGPDITYVPTIITDALPGAGIGSDKTPADIPRPPATPDQTNPPKVAANNDNSNNDDDSDNSDLSASGQVQVDAVKNDSGSAPLFGAGGCSLTDSHQGEGAGVLILLSVLFPVFVFRRVSVYERFVRRW